LQAHDWSTQQVRRLCDGKYLNFLIADHFEFLCEICQVRPECGSLLLAALLRNAAKLNKVIFFTLFTEYFKIQQQINLPN